MRKLLLLLPALVLVSHTDNYENAADREACWRLVGKGYDSDEVFMMLLYG